MKVGQASTCGLEGGFLASEVRQTLISQCG
jgi:hypothetical protein